MLTGRSFSEFSFEIFYFGYFHHENFFADSVFTNNPRIRTQHFFEAKPLQGTDPR